MNTSTTTTTGEYNPPKYYCRETAEANAQLKFA